MAKEKITQVTVKQMYEALGKAIENGDGDKFLVCGCDNEGNGYYGCFNTLTPFEPFCSLLLNDSQVTDPNQLLIIG